MKDLEIERITVYVVGPETERHAWASDMHAQFMTNTILRAQTRGGLEGVAGVASFSSGRCLAGSSRGALAQAGQTGNS